MSASTSGLVYIVRVTREPKVFQYFRGCLGLSCCLPNAPRVVRVIWAPHLTNARRMSPLYADLFLQSGLLVERGHEHDALTIIHFLTPVEVDTTNDYSIAPRRRADGIISSRPADFARWKSIL